MPALTEYRLFISHAWDYNTDYYKLLELLNAAPNFKFSNYSVPEHDPFDTNNSSRLKELIREQIRRSSIVIILGGMYVAYSDWIQFEIDFSVVLEKPILGITPRGAEKMPQAVTLAAQEIVGWNTDSIVAAIRKLAG